MCGTSSSQSQQSCNSKSRHGGSRWSGGCLLEVCHVHKEAQLIGDSKVLLCPLLPPLLVAPAYSSSLFWLARPLRSPPTSWPMVASGTRHVGAPYLPLIDRRVFWCSRKQTSLMPPALLVASCVCRRPFGRLATSHHPGLVYPCLCVVLQRGSICFLHGAFCTRNSIKENQSGVCCINSVRNAVS